MSVSRNPRSPGVPDPGAALAELPLLAATRPEWAPRAAAELARFLADHAVCEQQVAQYALSLAGFYPEDLELVEVAGALAAEEVQHFRRVVTILKRRRWPLAGRRTNRWAQALRQRIAAGREPWTKVDRLCFGALIEARSCERFTRLLVELAGRDPEVERLLEDLGPAEARHWRLFRRLAGRGLPAGDVEARFRGWLEFEAQLQAGLGVEPTVHG